MEVKLGRVEFPWASGTRDGVRPPRLRSPAPSAWPGSLAPFSKLPPRCGAQLGLAAPPRLPSRLCLSRLFFLCYFELDRFFLMLHRIRCAVRFMSTEALCRPPPRVQHLDDDRLWWTRRGKEGREGPLLLTCGTLVQTPAELLGPQPGRRLLVDSQRAPFLTLSL